MMSILNLVLFLVYKRKKYHWSMNTPIVSGMKENKRDLIRKMKVRDLIGVDPARSFGNVKLILIIVISRGLMISKYIYIA